MKKNKTKDFIKGLAVSTLIVGLAAPSIINGNEVEEVGTDEVEETTLENTLDFEGTIETNDVIKVEDTLSKESLVRGVPTDWAFTDESKPLNDAIIAVYGSRIDTNNDNYISISEANAYRGRLSLTSKGITGTLNGIENFINITQLSLQNNQLTGMIPENIGNLKNLTSLSFQNNQLNGKIPESINQITGLTSFLYMYNNIESSDLHNLKSLSTLGITRATNINLTETTSFFVSGSKEYGDSMTRVAGVQGFISWDTNTGYYIINDRATYAVVLPVSGTDTMILSNYINLPEGGLMDNEGNIILGATTSDIVDGKVILKNGGTVITGDVTYVFDDYSIIGEKDIVTEGNITSAKNTTDGSTVAFGEIKTEARNQNGETIVIDLSDSVGKTTLQPGTVVKNNNGSITYIVDEATMDNEGNIISAGTIITVPAEEVTKIVENSDGRHNLPENSTVTMEGEDTLYPGTITFVTADGSVKYNPISDLVTPDGTGLSSNTDDKALSDAQSIVDRISEGKLKNQLQSIVDSAKDMIDAKNKTEGLYNSNGSLKDSVTSTIVQEVIDAINKLPEGNFKTDLLEQAENAKNILNARDAVKDLFTTDGTDLATGVTQEDINSAKELVNALPNGPDKESLLDDIEYAQNLLDQQETAKDAVDNLFNEDKTDLGTGVGQKEIDAAQKELDKLSNGSMKDELQKEVDLAQDMLNAKNKTSNLFDSEGNIKTEVTQTEIDEAQEAVNKLPNGVLKDLLQELIDEAQEQFDSQGRPSVAPPVNSTPKASVDSTTNSSNVNTGDMTDLTMLYAMIATSLLGATVIIKKRNEVKKIYVCIKIILANVSPFKMLKYRLLEFIVNRPHL